MVGVREAYRADFENLCTMYRGFESHPARNLLDCFYNLLINTKYFLNFNLVKIIGI
jgi:hypothetical protein